MVSKRQLRAVQPIISLETNEMIAPSNEVLHQRKIGKRNCTVIPMSNKITQLTLVDIPVAFLCCRHNYLLITRDKSIYLYSSIDCGSLPTVDTIPGVITDYQVNNNSDLKILVGASG